jgi:hypothetical protein
MLMGAALAQQNEPYYPVGSIIFETTSIAAGLGASWGNGWMIFQGQQYPISVQGLSVGAVGISKVNAVGNVYNLNNGWKQPVITSLYCGTVAFNANPCFGEAWLEAGSPSQPKGAVGFFGASFSGTSTRWNNCLDYGIYHGIFNEGITDFGPAMLRGKLEIFENFPMLPERLSGVEPPRGPPRDRAGPVPVPRAIPGEAGIARRARALAGQRQGPPRRCQEAGHRDQQREAHPHEPDPEARSAERGPRNPLR